MKGKIAYIEDEHFFANVIEKKLQEKGFEIDTFPDGESGLKAVKGGDYSLVLLDLVLPTMDGFEVLKALKENPATKNTPIVILSNQAGEENRTKALTLGAKGYLVKVNSMPNEIANMVQGLCGG